ncbi:DUF2796 domain-containing protein [Cupriavidus sp. AU9028]|nr:DUF2796 domain-containing protein [Cupriavidus sp. AU9028]
MPMPTGRRYRAAAGFAASLCLLAHPGGVDAADPHVHGQATLEVVLDGPVLSIRFASPLDNILGFERLPRNEQERGKVQAALQRLRNGGALFVPAAQAGCRLEAAQLDFGALQHGLTGEGKPPAAGAHQHQHADLDAGYRFRCERPQALDSLEVRLFRAFPGVTRIGAQLASERRQSGATLTPANPRLSW